MLNIVIGNKIITKKPHACKNNVFEVVRVGADVKIKCLKCGKIIMIDRVKCEKLIKEVCEGDNEL